jgi:hypothetical protein
MIAANGGITSATIDTMTAAAVEYRSSTAQDKMNSPMQIAMRMKYMRLSPRDPRPPP